MSPRILGSALRVAALVLAVQLAPHAARAGWPNDPRVNLPVCTYAGDQGFVGIAADGAGGLFLTWPDARSGTDYWPYAQHVNASGVSQWTVGGVLLAPPGIGASFPKCVPDGDGGVIVCWQDARNDPDFSAENFDVFAQRLDRNGQPLWGAGGLALCTAPMYQYDPVIASDGAGGAIVAWCDPRNSESVETMQFDIYAQHVSATGQVLWTADGLDVCDAPEDQNGLTILADGAGGAFLGWFDMRSGVEMNLYAQHLDGAGGARWATGGVSLCSAPDDQQNIGLVPDGAGGVVASWLDFRLGYARVYAQRLDASGTPRWTPNGVLLESVSDNPQEPCLVSDGAGGAIIAWFGYLAYGGPWSVRAQRIDSAGALRWGPSGIAVTTTAGFQYRVDHPAIASDGAGGAIVAWQWVDFSSHPQPWDLFAQRLSDAGLARWTPGGVAICTAPGWQQVPQIIADGGGGALLGWMDHRGEDIDIYSQHVDRWGVLGGQPELTSVADVPGDQGGWIRVAWTASPLETASPGVVGAYVVQRLDGSLWNSIGMVPATGAGPYTFAAQTLIDSTDAASPWSTFRVCARTPDGTKSWDSDPDSARSVDNLPPAMPSGFTGEFVAGSAHLRWARSRENDLAGYRLYRGGVPDFEPGSPTMVATIVDTEYVDPCGIPAFYKLAAVDVHGNASDADLLQPDGTASVPGTETPSLALERAGPNPTPGARLEIRFRLAMDAPARLELVDVSGRRVAGCDVGALGAGAHAVDLAAGRRLAPGLYVVRLIQGGRTCTTRVTVLR
jgi:hypothetical protein